MGECFESVYVIGSPDIDIMLSNDLPSLQQVKDYYEIKFAHYAIVLFHPVTTEIESLEEESDIFVSALLKSDINYIIIYPNNDEGSDKIFHSYRKLESNPRFRMFPSLRFEYFLTLLKHAQFIIGNSSAGIREAPVYGVPSIDIGTRQRRRFTHDSIIESNFDESMIIASMTKACNMQRLSPCHYFGYGKSTSGFMDALASTALWNTAKQKHFQDIAKVK
jgi:UDP-N-acetylglucosamine 2-epimerase (hydrolysing)